MVMNFAVFDTNLHMSHHYKRINSAKSVINTFAPRSYQLKYNKTLSNLTSRYSSPILSSYNRIPSRANSNCDDHRRIKTVTSEMTDGRRSNSVPPRPGTRRNQNVAPQNFIKSSSPYPQINDNNSSKIPLIKDSPNTATANSPTNNKMAKIKPGSKNCNNVCKGVQKIPIPTPRTLSPTKPAAVEDYEYLQFSLRITEDIIRNDLYSQKEMRRVFNSHIEANRGRLNLKKMLLQIDHLCIELEISKKSSNLKSQIEQSCQTFLSPKDSKENLIKKIVNGEHVTEEEIHELTESDLENVISGVLNDEMENTSQKPSSSIRTTESVLQSTQKTVESSTKASSNPICDVIHSNVQNFSCLSEEDLKTISSTESSKVAIKDVKKEETEQHNIIYGEYESLKAVTKENNSNLSSETANETIKYEENLANICEDITKPRSSIESYDEKLKAVLICVPKIVQQPVSPEEQIKSEELIIDREIYSKEEIKENYSEGDIKEYEIVEQEKQLSTIEENESQETFEPEESFPVLEQKKISTISSIEETNIDEAIEQEKLKSKAQVFTNEPSRKSFQDEENKEPEVSIIAQTIPVNNTDTSASLNTVKSRNSESKTTQTLLTVDENNKLIKTSISDYDETDAFNFVQSSSTKTEVVYDNEIIEETKASKDKFISSITQFILNRSFSQSKPELNISFPEEKQKSVEFTKKTSEKSEFISSIEKIINSKTEDLYQYSKDNPPSKERLPALISSEDLDKYQTEYSRKYSAKKLEYKTSKRKNSENILSDGEVSKLSSKSSVLQKIRGRIIKRSQPDILEHLKKYEQNNLEKNSFQKSCVCDYEIKAPFDNYIPKFKRSMFFPTASTQTSSTDFNFKTGFNENLLSDGEIQNISTDLSEDESFSR